MTDITTDTTARMRAQAYGFLSALMIDEPSEALLDALSCGKGGPQWQECGLWLADGGEKAREDVRVDFARLFANACDAPVHPFESVYLNPDKLLMQEERDRVVEAYLAASYAVDESLHLPEDHVGFELAFLAALVETGEDEQAAAFLSEHVLAWVPQLCRDIAERAQTPFYRCIASECLRFLAEEAHAYGIEG